MSDGREPDLIDAMVAIIRNATIDAETARMAATVVSIDANFNARAASLKKQNVEQGRMLELLDFAEEVLADARALASAVEQGIASAEAGKRLLALRGRISSYDI